MELEDLLLKREEISVGPCNNEFSSSACIVPIHPSLKHKIPDEIRFSRALTYHVLNDAIDWYVEDMKRYYDKLGYSTEDIEIPEKKEEWREKAVLTGVGYVTTVQTSFLFDLGISANIHMYPCSDNTFDDISSTYIRFSKEKFLEFSKDDRVMDFGDSQYFCRAYSWRQHNVGAVKQAIFLRNWAILYENLLLRLMNEKDLL